MQDSFFFQAEDGIRDFHVTGVQTCALPIFSITARIRANEITMPPRAATAPPVCPVPAPRGTTGVPVESAKRTTRATSSVVRGTTTTSGIRVLRSDQKDASYA